MPASENKFARLITPPVLFGFILLLLVLAMASAIFLKQRLVTPGINFRDVWLWQMVIWIPLVFVIPTLQWVIGKYSSLLIWLAVLIILVALHYGWFVGMSSLISPYLEFPRTRYGVYPFFFIFWTLIDIFLLSGMLFYLLILQKKAGLVTNSVEQFLYVKKGNRRVLLKPKEIYWIGADDYYSDIHSSKGRFLERKSLKALLELLPAENFIRIHRSTVVNINAIREFKPISGVKGEVELEDGNTRIVSRTYLKALKECLTNARA